MEIPQRNMERNQNKTKNMGIHTKTNKIQKRKKSTTRNRNANRKQASMENQRNTICPKNRPKHIQTNNERNKKTKSILNKKNREDDTNMICGACGKETKTGICEACKNKLGLNPDYCKECYRR